LLSTAPRGNGTSTHIYAKPGLSKLPLKRIHPLSGVKESENGSTLCLDVLPLWTGSMKLRNKPKKSKLHCWVKERVQLQAGSDLSKHVPLLWQVTVGIKTIWHVSQHQHHCPQAACKGWIFDPATIFSLLTLLHNESSVFWSPASPLTVTLWQAWGSIRE
jgi:hypothetical protein